jgi:hypothetical protein
MFVNSFVPSTQSIARQASPRDGLVGTQHSSVPFYRKDSNRSGTTPPDNADSFQGTIDINQQIATFFQNATGTRQELEADCLASILGKHLQKADNIGSLDAMKAKLLVYLQTDDLEKALQLLNGTHYPLKNEFTGFFQQLQNKMQSYVQEQPAHSDLKPELASFEAFEQHVKSLRRQMGLYLGAVEPKQRGALVPKTPKTIQAATEEATKQLQAITEQITVLETLSSPKLLDAAITHHLETSPESLKMLKIAWLGDLLEQVKNKKVGEEGSSLLENEQVRHHLRGVMLSLDGDHSEGAEFLLKSTIAQLAPATSTSESILAPVPQQIVDALITQVQMNMGLPKELLDQLPQPLQSVEALKTAMQEFLQGLLTSRTEGLDVAKRQKALAFAKSQLSPSHEKPLIEAYQSSLPEQAKQLEQRLVHLESLPPDKLVVQLEEFIETQQEKIEAFVQTAVNSPFIQKIKALKEGAEAIPQKVESAVQRKREGYLGWEGKRIDKMNNLETYIEQSLREMAHTIQTEAQKIQEQISENVQKTVVKPIQKKAGQVEKGFNAVKTTIAAVITPVTTTVNSMPSIPVTAVPTPPSLPSSDGVVFHQALAKAEKQGEKAGWFAGFMEQNKTWLPWAIGGTVGLGLLATIGVWASKKRNPQNPHRENQAPQHS